MKRPGLIYPAALAVLLITAAGWPVRVVETHLPREGDKTIAVNRIAAGDMIRLNYRHSNELIEVEGRFAVNDAGKITAEQTRFESVGSGLPVSFPGRTSRDGDWLVVDEMSREIETLRFYIMPVNRTRLTIGDHPVPVGDLDPGTLIEVRVLQVAGIKWILKYCRLLS